MNPISMTIKNASAFCGLGPTTLYALIKEGKVDARKSGKRTLVLADSLRQHIENLPKVEG